MKANIKEMSAIENSFHPALAGLNQDKELTAGNAWQESRVTMQADLNFQFFTLLHLLGKVVQSVSIFLLFRVSFRTSGNCRLHLVMGKGKGRGGRDKIVQVALWSFFLCVCVSVSKRVCSPYRKAN